MTDTALHLPRAPALPLATTFQPSRRAGGLLLVGGLHLLAVWGLMQMGRVHEVLREVAPVMVRLIQAPAAAPAAPPPLPAPPRAARPDPAPLQPLPPVVVPTAPAAPPPAPVQAVAEPVAASPVAPPPAAAPAAPVTVATPAAAAPAGPRMLPSSAVQYVVPPEVEYPRASRRLKETGRVVVRVLITEAGQPDRLSIERSSGFPRLDEAALAAVRKTRFRPYVENGQPQSGWALVPLSFDLDP